MKLTGKLIKGTSILSDAAVEEDLEGRKFHEVLESCLITLCRDLDIPVPLWLKKNTSEFARFRRTFFPREQFLEKVGFDRFEIEIEIEGF